MNSPVTGKQTLVSFLEAPESSSKRAGGIYGGALGQKDSQNGRVKSFSPPKYFPQ
jgi:hypothetical protein